MTMLDNDAATRSFSAALAAEDAAVYGYGLVQAYANESRRATIDEALTAHRERRTRIAAALEEAGVAPRPAVQGYVTRESPDAPDKAARFATGLEADCASAWRTALGEVSTREAREFAMDALDACWRMRQRWATLVGDASPALP